MTTILVLADYAGKTEPALFRAVEFAAQDPNAETDVHVVAFVHDDFVGKMDRGHEKDEFKSELLTRRQQTLKGLIKENKLDAKVKIKVEIVWEKRITTWVTEHLKQNKDYSMIVKTGHRSESIVHTPLDWQLLRKSPIPVLLVSKKKWKKRNNILLALDLDTRIANKKRLNDKVIEHGKDLAARVGGQLHCVHAIHIPQIIKDLEMFDLRKVKNEKVDKVSPYLHKLAKKHDLDPDNFHIRLGKPEKVIMSYANKLKADVVVLGTIGRRKLAAKMLGNTAEKIMRYAYTDILAVKP
ncbi:MAG: universal stress protein [Gammaproteobacteria bacterium]|nr:universal stress protein [Gammaproteobacteria bacterium]NNC98488.1 universal stress protein [Gammaproteobacteria bacterium]NNM13101.1 universal stress protein [Gammaproteobacteria bacterium]